MTAFVDASFLIALLHKNDTFHPKAKKIAEEMKIDSVRLLTSNVAIAEVINYIFRTQGPKAAQEYLTAIEKIGPEEIFVSQENFQDAYKLLFHQKSKKGLGFFDCLHLVTMKALGIKTILSFDKRFKRKVKTIGI